MSRWEQLRTAAGGVSGSALIHGGTAVIAGVILMVEPPGGYTFRVWDGAVALLGWTGRPFTAWGALLLVLGLAVLALQRHVSSRWVLAQLTGVWWLFGGSALYVGLTSTQAASLGGLAWIALGAGCLRAALAVGELSRVPDVDIRQECPLREDCLRIPHARSAGDATPRR